MAYTGGNKRWTGSFKSLNNTTCRIDIYMKDYTGSFIQNVTCAADPFFYEEDDDSDLLNDVLRYRTGYIRLVEEYDSGSTLSLDEIYPSGVFDRYVEVFYGSDLVFNGYIQVQDFNNELVPVPKVIELPVISPLGLMKQKTFSNTQYLPPSSVSLGSLLDTILTNMGYSYLYMPKNYGNITLAEKIFSLAVSPWNDDYHHSINVGPANYVMTGKDYEFVVDAVCKAFGWICHDTPTALVFTSFDYEDTYCYYPVGHIGETGYRSDSSVPYAASALTDNFDPADKKATMMTLQPDTGIEIRYDGSAYDQELSFKRTYIPSSDGVVIQPSYIPDMDLYPAHAEIFSLCNLIPISQAGEFDSSLGALTFDNYDKINVGKGCCAWNGHEGVMISMASYSSGVTLFYVRVYLVKRQGRKYGFSYKMMGRKDGYISGLSEDGIESYYVYTEYDNTHENYIQINFKYRYGGQFAQLPLQSLIFIYDMEFKVFEDAEPYSDYRYAPASDSDIIAPAGTDTNITPAISSSVTMPISLYRNNDHLIGTTMRTTKLTEYPYLFQPRKELKGIFRLISAPTFPHIRLFSYLGKKWRIIAQRFDPWDDEMTLTLQNSPVL